MADKRGLSYREFCRLQEERPGPGRLVSDECPVCSRDGLVVMLCGYCQPKGRDRALCPLCQGEGLLWRCVHQCGRND